MKSVLESLVAGMTAALGDRVHGTSEFRDDVTIHIAADAIIAAAAYLRDNPVCPFPLCEDLFAIDQYRKRDRFEVKYHFFSLRERVRVHLKLAVDESNPHVPSITGVYPSAGFAEREAYDMHGIVFDGHPDLRRMYMPEDYAPFPMRKDFPLMGIPDSIPLPKR